VETLSLSSLNVVTLCTVSTDNLVTFMHWVVLIVLCLTLCVSVNQYAMMEHFYKNKASILCRPLDEACKRAAQLSSNQLADVRSCDSFQRYYYYYFAD